MTPVMPVMPVTPFTALLLMAALAALALAGAWALRRRLNAGTTPPPRCLRVRAPLSVAQQVLMARLLRALPDHIILTQVQALQLLDPYPQGRRNALQLGLRSLRFDFVVCNPGLAVMAAIELDDPQQASRRRSRHARRKERACAAAGLRWLRWSARGLPDEAAIRLEFQAYQQAQRLIQGARYASRLQRRA